MRTVGAPPIAGPRTVIERTIPTDLTQLACEVPGSPVQVAAVLVLGAAANREAHWADATGRLSCR